MADNEGLVRSTTGLAHTVQLTLETASQEGQPQPSALVADAKVCVARENERERETEETFQVQLHEQFLGNFL